MRVLIVLAVAFLSTSVPAFADPGSDLLDGVTRIAAPGVPGPLSVVGDKAWPVVAVPGDGHLHPVVAAARYGKGRVVAFGHSGYLDPKTQARNDTRRLVSNAIRWAGGDPVVIRDLPKELERIGVLVMRPAVTLKTDADIERVRAFVRGGGGLVVAGLGWGWKQLNPGKSLSADHPGNRLLAPMGIVWADGYLKAPGAQGYAVAGPAPDVTHAVRAIDSLAKERKDRAHAAAIVTRAVAALPIDDPFLIPRVARLARTTNVIAALKFERPLGPSDALPKILLAYEIKRLKRGEGGWTGLTIAARSFPGDVPKGAVRASHPVKVDLSVPRRASTGLYAPPGKAVTIRTRDAIPDGLRIRIGAHSDRLYGKKEWKRAPQVGFTWPLTGKETRIPNPFGGLVYVEVPKNAGDGEIGLLVMGVVRSPRFVLDRTDPKRWREKIRAYPAPWAEIGTSKVILTVPSRVVRELDDPRPVLDFWDRVLDACADLAGRPRERRRPERYVTDIQISVGYMHAGYPIMTHLDVAGVVVDVAAMKAGRWGLFHEMGHNHQSRDWTFAGAGEVTVNLFTLYVLETVCADAGMGHGALSPTKRARATAAHLAAGAPFSVWKKKPFLALYSYVQLREGFGWEAFRKVFAEYRDLPLAERPKTDDEKRDQWLVRFSRTVGKNLGPFLTTWGIPTSEAARESIGDLPTWMPPNFPPR